VRRIADPCNSRLGLPNLPSSRRVSVESATSDVLVRLDRITSYFHALASRWRHTCIVLCSGLHQPIAVLSDMYSFLVLSAPDWICSCHGDDLSTPAHSRAAQRLGCLKGDEEATDN
jgi:hypothetical protein